MRSKAVEADIDIAKRVVIFVTSRGETMEVSYDVIPKVVRPQVGEIAMAKARLKSLRYSQGVTTGDAHAVLMHLALAEQRALEAIGEYP